MASRTIGQALTTVRRRGSGKGRFADFRSRLRHRHDPYRCQEAVELVTEYIEGAMTPVEIERFERHLRTCRACGYYVEQTRRTVDVLGRVHPQLPSSHTCDALIRLFHEVHRT